MHSACRAKHVSNKPMCALSLECLLIFSLHLRGVRALAYRARSSSALMLQEEAHRRQCKNGS